jgi:DNA-binding IclR family transcriptional regulator
MRRDTESVVQRKVTRLAVSRDNSVRTLDKGLLVVEHLSRMEGDIDLASLTRELKMPKTTVLRLLNTLRKHNFVQKDARSGRYSLGWALIYIGQSASRAFNLVEFAHPFLERLSRETGETANLVLLDEQSAVYVDQVISTNIIRGVPRVGTPLGLHCTAAGKVLLGWQTDEVVEQALTQSDMPVHTSKTITEPEVLRRELEKIRNRGWAVDDEESEMGGRCIAAPVFEKTGNLIASISVMGPTNRVNPETIPALSGLLVKTAEEISKALGYQLDSKF